MGAIAVPVTADRIIATAAAEVGTAESPHGSNRQRYGEWYGMNGVAWCAEFVSWVLHHAGWSDFAVSTPKGFSYCPAGAQWFKDRGAWADKHTVPKRGWVVFFDFPGDGVNRISHVGLVEGVLATGQVATIEGNTDERGGRTGGRVMRHNRTPAGGIAGYGVLTFPSNNEEDDVRFDADDKKFLTDIQNAIHHDVVTAQGMIEKLQSLLTDSSSGILTQDHAAVSSNLRKLQADVDAIKAKVGAGD